MSNPIAKLYKAYKTVTINPAINSALLGLGTWWLAKKSIPMIQQAAINASLAATGKSEDPRARAQMQRNAQLQRQTPYWSSTIPKAIGIATALLTLAGNTDFNKQWNGWFSWNPKNRMQVKASLDKKASFWQSIGYQPSFQFDQVINSNEVKQIFDQNPILNSDRYAKNFGKSIINAAPTFNYGNTTLGSIYDSAVNKFQNKMTLHGVAKQGLKGLVSGALAGMFTDTLGTVMGLPSASRNTITKSVALGSALYSILT